jgi:hypothetical protein
MKTAVLPLVLLWLAVHAALLAMILAAKFLFTKTVFLILLAAAGTVFLFTRFRASPRKLFHSPVV